MEGNTSMLHLTLPGQSLASLSFCEAAPKPFREWAQGLPMTNIGETSRRLYHAIIELNQLIIPAQQRVALLELIRPPIYYVCGELSRHYLGHSISLPEKQRKVANLAQALQLHLAGGYKQALVELIRGNGLEKNTRLIGQCAHRAITDLASTILRSAQLYCPSPTHSWLESHRIFRFMDLRQMGELRVDDETNSHNFSTTVAEAYKRSLLLGCCRPNQLRQNELSQIYGLFESWAKHTEFTVNSVDEALFIVNTERDAPPIYRSLLTEPVNREFFGFDTGELSHRLSETLTHLRDKKAEAPKLLDMPAPLNEALAMHLSQALGILAKRSFKRLANSGRLSVCVGMSAAHYYTAGKTDFNQFLGMLNESDTDENVFLTRARRKEDAWCGAHDAGPSESLVAADTPINFRGATDDVLDRQGRGLSYPSFKVSLLNTSPGGYCLHWDEAVPASLQAGEILAVREQDSHPWSLAVIRWIRLVRQQGTLVGVELLAPNSVPCAVRLIQKVGNNSGYLRGLLLPELGSIDQPATLITPRMPFHVGNRIVLFHDGREEGCQLSRRVSATGSVSQFELRFFPPVDPGQKSGFGRRQDSTDDDFDSLWPSL